MRLIILLLQFLILGVPLGLSASVLTPEQLTEKRYYEELLQIDSLSTEYKVYLKEKGIHNLKGVPYEFDNFGERLTDFQRFRRNLGILFCSIGFTTAALGTAGVVFMTGRSIGPDDWLGRGLKIVSPVVMISGSILLISGMILAVKNNRRLRKTRENQLARRNGNISILPLRFTF